MNNQTTETQFSYIKSGVLHRIAADLAIDRRIHERGACFPADCWVCEDGGAR